MLNLKIKKKKNQTCIISSTPLSLSPPIIYSMAVFTHEMSELEFPLSLHCVFFFLKIFGLSVCRSTHLSNLQPITFGKCYYRPKRSCGQGYVFTRVCDSVNRGGGGSPENPPGTRQPTPPGPGNHPPGPGNPPRTRQPPRDQATPPGPGNPPRHQADPPPVGKNTAAYGQWAAGTHPTVMHSCFCLSVCLSVGPGWGWHEVCKHWRF